MFWPQRHHCLPNKWKPFSIGPRKPSFDSVWNCQSISCERKCTADVNGIAPSIDVWYFHKLRSPPTISCNLTLTVICAPIEMYGRVKWIVHLHKKSLVALYEKILSQSHFAGTNTRTQCCGSKLIHISIQNTWTPPPPKKKKPVKQETLKCGMGVAPALLRGVTHRPAFYEWLESLLRVTRRVHQAVDWRSAQQPEPGGNLKWQHSTQLTHSHFFLGVCFYLRPRRGPRGSGVGIDTLC